MPSCKTKNTGHDGEEHLGSNQLPLPGFLTGALVAYVEFGVALCARLEGCLAGFSLAFSSGAGPSSEGRGGALDTRGGAEGRAGDDGGHGGCN